MACVSLIVPIAPGSALFLDRIAVFERSLGEAGHDVEVLIVADPRDPGALDNLAPPLRGMVAGRAGKAASAYVGLREATGEFLVILDLDKNYAPENLGRVLEPLIRGDAEVVVASNSREPRVNSRTKTKEAGSDGRWFTWISALTRPLIGITDPSSGLVAVTRASYRERGEHPVPLGSRFVLELLVGAVGRRAEVSIRRRVKRGRVVLRTSDLRLMKRLVDDRFGNLSRLIQFCIVGASGMVIDLSCYALFQYILSRTDLSRIELPLLAPGQSLDLAVSGALAIAVAVVWNFSLNRRLTFNDARQGSIWRQFFTYILGNALGIALSLSLRLILPSRIGFFDRHRLAAAVVGIVAATGISFSMSRWIVFTNRRSPRSEHRHHCEARPSAIAERVS